MFSRYWNFTTCMRSDNLAAIAQAVTHLLEQEEGCLITQLPQLTIDLEQLRHLPVWERPRLWVVGLFGGTGGWTIVLCPYIPPSSGSLSEDEADEF